MIDINLLQNSAYHEHFASGQFIVSANGRLKKMYILISGAIGVYDVGGNRTNTVVPGQTFGERFFFGGSHKHNYRAEQDAVVFAIAEDTFGPVTQASAALTFALMREFLISCGAVEEDAQGTFEAVRPANEAVEHELSPAMKMQKMLLEKAAAQSVAAAQKTEHTKSSVNQGQKRYGVLFPEGHKEYPGVQEPENKQVLFQKEYKCPYCGKTFQAYKIFASKLMPIGSPRYDFRKDFKDFKMEWYSVIVCPECYFSALIDYFTEPGSLVKQKIKQELEALHEDLALDFSAERDLDFVFAAHYLALRCAPALPSKQKQIDLKLWSELSWLYEDAGDHEMELFAVNKAAEAGEALYMGGNLNPVQEQMICMQIAGLLYRTGERENMSRWLFKAKTSKMGKRVYTNMADDLWEAVKDEKHGTKE